MAHVICVVSQKKNILLMSCNRITCQSGQELPQSRIVVMKRKDTNKPEEIILSASKKLDRRVTLHKSGNLCHVLMEVFHVSLLRRENSFEDEDCVIVG